MFNIIRDSFKITNNYIIIATPLILFSLISGLYLYFSGHGSVFSLLSSMILFFLMLTVFFAGWFFMVTKAVKESITQESLIQEFIGGIGEYFLPILGFLFNILILSTILIIAAFVLGKKFIGSPGVSSTQIMNAMQNISTMTAFAESLTKEQLIKINQWNILLFATMVFNYFIFIFYAPAMYFKQKNPYIALWLAIKDLFSTKFFKNIGLFFMIFISYMLLSAISTLFGSNVIAHFILTLANFYYVTFIVILIFNYYYSNYAKIGSTIDKMV